jgi:hypothetical protein
LWAFVMLLCIVTPRAPHAAALQATRSVHL